MILSSALLLYILVAIVVGPLLFMGLVRVAAAFSSIFRRVR